MCSSTDINSECIFHWVVVNYVSLKTLIHGFNLFWFNYFMQIFPCKAFRSLTGQSQTRYSLGFDFKEQKVSLNSSMDFSITSSVEMLHLTFLKANQGNNGHHDRLRKSIQIQVVQVNLSIICSRSGKSINCSGRYCFWSGSILSLLAWVVDWVVYFSTLSSLLFFGRVGGGLDKVVVVFLADRALESKIISTDLNDVLKSTRWSPKYRPSNKKSRRYKRVPIPEECSQIWMNSMTH